MKKVLFSVFLLLSSFTSLSADWLYQRYDKCINDYYYSGGTFYYKTSKDDKWHYISNNNNQEKIFSGFIYDSSNDICIPNPDLLGLSKENFVFLNGLIAVFVSVLMVWSLI